MTITTDDNSNQIIIRLAEIGDCERIALLCSQLGYPTSEAAVKKRLLPKNLGLKPRPCRTEKPGLTTSAEVWDYTYSGKAHIKKAKSASAVNF